MTATRRVKRFSCSQCGATNQHAPRGPYVECETCATLVDFDGATARRSRDWYRSLVLEKQLFARHEDDFRGAIDDGDRERWQQIYRGVLLEQIARCPGLYPSGVADPAYRDRFVAWLLGGYEMLYWELELQRLAAAMSYIEVPIVDGRADSAAFWRRTEVADQLYTAQDRINRVLGNTPPEHFPPGFLRTMNLSLYVQEWLPDLAEDDARRLLERTRTAFDYIAAAEAGNYGCLSCGAEVQLPAQATLMICPYCRSALRPTLGAPTIGPRQWAVLCESDEDLAAIGEIAGLVIADGTLQRGGGEVRTILIQAIAGAPARAIELSSRELAPDLPFAEFLHAWAELEAERRKIPLERRWFREHPHATTVPRDERELDARLAAMNAPAGPARVELVTRGPGCACDVVIAAQPGLPWTLRLVRDDDSRGVALYQRWAARVRG